MAAPVHRGRRGTSDRSFPLHASDFGDIKPCESTLSYPIVSIDIPHQRTSGSQIGRVPYHRDRGESAARGLYVQVRAADGGGWTRSWLYRFTSPITRKERWMGLGSTDVIGLAEARELARAARRLVTLGADPIEKRRETIQAERDAVIRDRASRMTFRQCADAFLHSHDKDRQWRVALDLAGAAFGDLPVGEIDTAMVVKFLEPH
ncbi:MAG: integrase arm-type DNA-binding domain-containing protein, partial [Methyloceanibacter sp.]